MADVTRHGVAASGNADNPSFAIAAGTDRALIVGIQQEGDLTPDQVSVTWGGQAMTQLVTAFVDAGGTDQEVFLFLLLEAGIAAGVGTTIAITGQDADFTFHAQAYENVNQGGGASSVPETNSDTTAAATPNPLTGADIVAGDGAAVVALSGVGNATAAAWGADLTEQTEQQDTVPTTTGSLADGLFATGQNVNVEATWTAQNRAAVVSAELAPTLEGALSGSVALALAVAGALSAEVEIAGTIPLAIQATGGLSQTVPISGTIPLVLTPSATISEGADPSAIWYKTGLVVTPASGNQVVDVSDKGTLPVGVHFFWTDNTADQTIQVHAELGHGFSDGTNHRAVMQNAQDAVSNNFRQSSTTACILIVNPTDDTILVEATITLENEQFTIVYTTVSAGFQLHFEAWGGTGAAAVVGDVGADASPLTGLGLTNGDILLGFTSGEQFPASSQFAYQSYGAAHDNGVSIDQWCLFKYMGDNDEDFQGSAVTSTDFMGQYDVDFAAWAIQITAMSGDGATWTGTNADHFAFMMLDLGGIGVDVGTMTKTIDATPATHTFPDLGFVPAGYAIATASDISEDRTVNQACRGSFGAFDGGGTGHSINAITTVSANTPRDSLSSSVEVINMGQDFGGGNVQSPGQAQPITSSQPTIIFDPNTNQAEIIGYYAFEMVASIIGSIALTLTPTGTLTARGELAGSAALVVTPSATIRGVGALAGSSDLVFTVAGAMLAKAAAAGTIPLVLTPAGTLQARGALAGSAALVFTPAATIQAQGELAGSAGLVFTPAGNLQGLAGISGTIPMVIAATGALVGRGDLAGTAALAIAAAGTLGAEGALAGSVTMILTPAGTLVGRGALTGSAALVITPTATLQARGALLGTAALVFDVAGDLQAVGGNLAGAIPLVLTATGTLEALGALTGAAALTISPAGTLTATGGLLGAAALTFTLVGDLRALGALLGTADLVLTPAGQLAGLGALAGSSALAITPAGTLVGLGALTGAAALVFDATGNLAGGGGIAGTIPLTITPAATIRADAAMAGSADLVFDATGTLVSAGFLSGTIPLTLDAAGAILARGALAGGLTLTLTPAGTIVGQGALAGGAALVITPTGALSGGGGIAGTIDMTIDAAGNILAKALAQGTIDLTFTAAGTAQGRTAMQGTAALTLTADGTLIARGELQGIAQLAFTLTGIMFDQGARRIPNSLQSLLVFLENSRQDIAEGTDSSVQSLSSPSTNSSQ